MGSTKAIELGTVQSVTRLGLAADTDTQTTTNLFTVAGTVILVSIVGRVVAAKAVGAQTIRLGHVPTAGGVEAFLCAASATTSNDAIDELYFITGVIGDAMIVDPASGIGLSNLMVNEAGTVGTPQGLLLAPGILRMTTGAANDLTGLINWTARYIRIAAVGGGVPASTDGMTVL